MNRRVVSIVALGVLAGCAGLKDAFSGHQNVVARVGDHELTAEGLAQTIANSKNIPLQREILDRIANVWVDFQLVGQAMARGDSLLDSATIATVNWPLIAQRLADMLHDTLIVSRARLTPGQVDSAYNAGNVRYIYHILIATRDSTEAAKAPKRRIAEGLLSQIRRGADFSQLAGRHSDDPGSKVQGGRLGMMPRGIMVKPFEDAAFALAPGQISDVVPTPFGFHILWRPSLDAVRDSFTEGVRAVAVERLDSVYLDSLTNRTGIRVRGSAPARVRAAAERIDEAKTSSRVLATYNGGRMTERDFARWLQAYPANIRQQVAQAPDSTLIEFIKSIARNDMLLRSAASMGILVPPADWDSIRSIFGRELNRITSTLAVSPESLAADSAGGTDRAAVAARHIDAYFQSIVSPNNQRPYVEVPPFLADVLRERGSWRISQAGIDRALDRAKVIRGPEAPAAPDVPTMTPAPGGPPTSAPVGPPSRRIQ